jgi:hypothetical protein
MLGSHPKWVWVYCGDYRCGHARAVALVPWAIRWGVPDPLPLIKKNFRCVRCGAKGAVATIPSVVHGEGWLEFMPVGEDAVRPGGRRREGESCVDADNRNRVELLASPNRAALQVLCRP